MSEPRDSPGDTGSEDQDVFERMREAGLFSGNVAEGLEKLRQKLLDLGHRNRLLNFRHPARSSLRLTNTPPDHLFQTLLDGRSIALRAIPKPSSVQSEKYEAEIRITHGLPGDDPLPKALQNDIARKHAASLGIPFEFELPFSAPSTGDRQSVEHAITLLFPEDMDLVLENLRRGTRVAAEEKGVNALYLGFGFLEWFARDDLEKRFISPLILMPVTLDRGPDDRQTGFRRFSISFSGEDLEDNLSLREKLRHDFNLVLPSIWDPADSEKAVRPEDYFRSFEGMLQTKRDWKLHRWATLSLFEFSKLRMFKDLDPKEWPVAKVITNHKLVRRFFEAREAAAYTAHEEHRDLDAPPAADRTPIILDADASQHSALVDAVQGQNLVIQGPPGTGKSQTISNLIAAALNAGKTVLFVSEKMAALEVVRRRFDSAGLGQLCLELHSHRTQKRRLLDDLDRRLKLRGRQRPPDGLDREMQRLEHVRSKLNEYSELLAQRWGKLGWRIHRIIAAAVLYRQRLSFDPNLLSKVEVCDQQDIDDSALDDLDRSLLSFTDLQSQIVAEFVSWKSHPLYGFDNDQLSFPEFPNVIAAISELRDAAKNGDRTHIALEQLGGSSLESSVGAIRRRAETEKLWPSPKQVPPYFAALREVENRATLREFAARVKLCAETRDQLKASFDDVELLAADRLGRLEELLRATSGRLSSKLTLKELKALASACERAIDLCRRFEEQVSRAAQAFSLPLPDKPSSVVLLLNVVEIAAATPWSDLRYRSSTFRQPDCGALIGRLRARLNELKSVRENLSRIYSFRGLPSVEELEGTLRTLRAASPFRFLMGKWHSARRVHASLTHAEIRLPRRERIRSLEALVDHIDKCASFALDPQYRGAFGEAFRGVETEVTGLERLAAWYEAVRTKIGWASHVEALSQFIIDLSPDHLSELARWQERFPELRQFADLLSALRNAAFSALSHDSISLKDLHRELLESAEMLRKLHDAGKEARARDDISLGDLESAVSEALRLLMYEGVLKRSRNAAVLLDASFSGPNTDLPPLIAALDLADEIEKTGTDAPLRAAAFADSANGVERVKYALACLETALGRLDASLAAFASLARPQDKKWPLESIESSTISALVQRFERVLRDEHELENLIQYRRLGRILRDRGFATLVTNLEDGMLPSSDACDAMRYLVFSSISEFLLKNYEILGQFRRYSFEQLREQFSELDKDIMELRRQAIASRVDQRAVPAGIAGGRASEMTELALVKREIGKQKRHLPIRQLLRRAGRALLALKPCFMMSPLSVAQYIAPGELRFDLVVMDEASQIRPEEALGAIARAGQLVVVGDSKQLPPTSFFQQAGIDENDADDAFVPESSESILEAAEAIYPQRMLRWHYRSKHQSLISFSNRYFYDDDLVVFPSPRESSEEFGVKWNFVREGRFEGHRNIAEADAVVTTALKHMEEGRTESLGIVAMNLDQAELIETKVDHCLRQSAQAEKWVERRSTGPEPFFVKNLENVQGDERDVIIISFTYGNGASGPPRQQFGPINRDFGWRRLNVLYTRARKRVIVHASMRHDGISVEGTHRRSLTALRDYLQFAEKGQMPVEHETGRDPESPFESAVIKQLQTHGFECVPQLGVEKYRIDVAVRNPDRLGEFIVGIECDGAPYHSGRSVRDRDRIRQSILEGLGWTILRVWSPDWYRRPEKEIERLIGQIETKRAAERVRKSFATEPPPVETIVPSPGPALQLDVAFPSVASRKRVGLSVEEARDQLIQLREQEIKPRFPSIDPARGLLRKSMLDRMLLMRPTNDHEFRAMIPQSFRVETDAVHVREFLPKVFEIIAEIDD